MKLVHQGLLSVQSPYESFFVSSGREVRHKVFANHDSDKIKNSAHNFIHDFFTSYRSSIKGDASELTDSFVQLISFLVVVLRSRFSETADDKNKKLSQLSKLDQKKYPVSQIALDNYLAELFPNCEKAKIFKVSDALIVLCTHRNTSRSAVAHFPKYVKDLLKKLSIKNVDIDFLIYIEKKLNNPSFSNDKKNYDSYFDQIMNHLFDEEYISAQLFFRKEKEKNSSPHDFNLFFSTFRLLENTKYKDFKVIFDEIMKDEKLRSIENNLFKAILVDIDSKNKTNQACQILKNLFNQSFINDNKSDITDYETYKKVLDAQLDGSVIVSSSLDSKNPDSLSSEPELSPLVSSQGHYLSSPVNYCDSSSLRLGHSVMGSHASIARYSEGASSSSDSESVSDRNRRYEEFLKSLELAKAKGVLEKAFSDLDISSIDKKKFILILKFLQSTQNDLNVLISPENKKSSFIFLVNYSNFGDCSDEIYGRCLYYLSLKISSDEVQKTWLKICCRFSLLKIKFIINLKNFLDHNNGISSDGKYQLILNLINIIGNFSFSLSFIENNSSYLSCFYYVYKNFSSKEIRLFTDVYLAQLDSNSWDYFFLEKTLLHITILCEQEKTNDILTYMNMLINPLFYKRENTQTLFLSFRELYNTENQMLQNLVEKYFDDDWVFLSPDILEKILMIQMIQPSVVLNNFFHKFIKDNSPLSEKQKKGLISILDLIAKSSYGISILNKLNYNEINIHFLQSFDPYGFSEWYINSVLANDTIVKSENVMVFTLSFFEWSKCVYENFFIPCFLKIPIEYIGYYLIPLCRNLILSDHEDKKTGSQSSQTFVQRYENVILYLSSFITKIKDKSIQSKLLKIIYESSKQKNIDNIYCVFQQTIKLSCIFNMIISPLKLKKNFRDTLHPDINYFQLLTQGTSDFIKVLKNIFWISNVGLKNKFLEFLLESVFLETRNHTENNNFNFNFNVLLNLCNDLGPKNLEIFALRFVERECENFCENGTKRLLNLIKHLYLNQQNSAFFLINNAVEGSTKIEDRDYKALKILEHISDRQFNSASNGEFRKSLYTALTIY